MHRLGFARAPEYFRRILGDVRAAHLIGGVRAAAMKAERTEHRHATRGHNHRHTRCLAEITGLVTSSAIAHMLDQCSDADVRKRHHVRGAVGKAHVVHRRPACDIGRVGKTKVTAVLMPRKRHALFSGFDDVLIVKEKRRVTEGCATNFSHQFAENKLAQSRRAIVLLGDVVAFVAVANVDVISSQPIHLRMHRVDQVIARLAQNLQLLC